MDACGGSSVNRQSGAPNTDDSRTARGSLEHFDLLPRPYPEHSHTADEHHVVGMTLAQAEDDSRLADAELAQGHAIEASGAGAARSRSLAD